MVIKATLIVFDLWSLAFLCSRLCNGAHILCALEVETKLQSTMWQCDSQFPGNLAQKWLKNKVGLNLSISKKSGSEVAEKQERLKLVSRLLYICHV